MEVSTGFKVGQSETVHWDNKECRACLCKADATIDCFNLFEAWPESCPGVGHTLASDLAKLCYVQIEKGDGLPDVLCRLCLQYLNKAITFISQVQSNDKILRTRLCKSEDSTWPKPIQIDKNLTEFVPEHVDIKEEVLSENEMDTTEQYDYISIGEIKIEPQEIVMPSVHSASVNGYPENCGEGPINGVIDDNLLTTIKQEPKSDEEDLSIDVPLDCLLCTKSFKCISGLKAHVIAMHSYKGVKRKSSTSIPPVRNEAKHVCKICRRTFSTPTDLMVHETCHNKSVCYSCNKSFDTFQQLTKHRTRCKAAKTDIVKPKTLEDALKHPEETRTNADFKCSQCNERFTDIFYLQVHQEIHNTDTIEFNVKFDSDSDCEQGMKKTDRVKDDLEKMLQEDISTGTVDAVRDSLEKLLQSNDGTVHENKTINNQSSCEDTAMTIEADNVKKSLQKLLQSGKCMDSLNEIHKTNELPIEISKIKIVSKLATSDVQKDEKTQNVEEPSFKPEKDEVNESLQKLFKSHSTLQNPNEAGAGADRSCSVESAERIKSEILSDANEDTTI